MTARYLVIGASGLVGRALLRVLDSRQIEGVGTYARHPANGLLALDITDRNQVHQCLERVRPRTIFLTAALAHVDYCEDHPDEAARINVEGPRHVATEAARLGAKLVYYSTEYVFDGTNGPYSEEASPCPLSVYGSTKLEAEKVIQGMVQDCLILRTTIAYGWERDSANFAMQVYRKVQAGEPMTIPNDQIGNPTLAEYLAETSVRLSELGATGIVNVVGKDRLARSEFARALVSMYGGDPELVIPLATATLRQRAPRPLNGGLRTDKLSRFLGVESLTLDLALERLKLRWQSEIQ